MNSGNCSAPNHSHTSSSGKISHEDGDRAKNPIYTTWGDIIRHWPWTTLCIVGNEFCERFSFYGMRTVLTLYLLNVLRFSDRMSTVLFNGFTVLCYFTPIAGAVMADGFIGMFYTIFSISLVYVIGQILLAIASTQNVESVIHPWCDLLGLCIIGIGTGGIKPCVAPFGAEQFDRSQVAMISVYFSMFYFAINAGSTISTFISPLLRAQACMDQDSCYPLAFGLPALLMMIATGIFMIGSYSYRKPRVRNNVFADFSRLTFTAIRNKWKFNQKRKHWMDHYLDTHSCDWDEHCLELKKTENNKDSCQKMEFVEDAKSFIKVLIMYLPVPMFWALYDQQGSIWTIQAIQMDCRLWGNFLLLPDQMQTLNAVLILIFIPVFQVIIYPVIDRFIDFTPLRRMIVGGVLAAGAFIIAGSIQLQINKTLAEIPQHQQSFVSVMNNLESCNVKVVADGYPEIGGKIVPANQSLINDHSRGLQQLFRLHAGRTNFSLSYEGIGCKAYNLLPSNVEYDLEERKTHVIVLNNYGTYLTTVETEKPRNGNGDFAIIIQLAMAVNYTGNLALCKMPSDKSHFDLDHPCNPEDNTKFVLWQYAQEKHASDFLGTTTYQDSTGVTSNHVVSKYAYKAVRPGIWGLYYVYEYKHKESGRKITNNKYQINVSFTGVTTGTYEEGAVFLMVLTGDNLYNAKKYIFNVVPSNKISILWQFPQYFVITVAEILFSITGIEFAYSQASPSMKSIVQALWLLTSSVGDSIIVIIALWNPFNNMAIEFFAYACAMLGIMFIFAMLSIFYYEYNNYTGERTNGQKPLGRSIEDNALKKEIDMSLMELSS